MRRLSTGVWLFIVGIIVLAALPALAEPPSYNDPPPPRAQTYYLQANWTGPYIGGFGGGSFSDFHDHAGSDASFLGGGDIGFNMQQGHIVWGVEGDVSGFDNRVRTGNEKFDEDFMSTARARLGYSIDRFLPYVTAGLGLTDTVAHVPGVGSNGELEPGLAAGGGVDAMLYNNWFMRAEYLYVNVPKDSMTVGNAVIRQGSNNNTVRLGIGYKF